MQPQNHQGIIFGDIYWEIIEVSDQMKQAVKVLTVNPTKVTNSFVSLKGSVRNTTVLPATLAAVRHTTKRERIRVLSSANTSDLYVAWMGDSNGPQNMTSLSTGVLNAAESRFPANSKGQGIPIYPPGGNASLDNAKNGYEPGILGNYNTP